MEGCNDVCIRTRELLILLFCMYNSFMETFMWREGLLHCVTKYRTTKETKRMAEKQ